MLFMPGVDPGIFFCVGEEDCTVEPCNDEGVDFDSERPL